MDHTVELIREKLDGIQARIHQACRRAGRSENEVKLIVVSKAQPLEVLQMAYQAGARCFGENYPQESEEKILQWPVKDVEWHMIGHVQSRKAKIIANHFTTLHSLDSLELAQKLDRYLAENGRRLPVLLEINVGNEESKGGWRASTEAEIAQLAQVIDQLSAFKTLQVQGLMAMPPWNEVPEESRVYFKFMVDLRRSLTAMLPAVSFDQLSMGTSVDFEVAIEEGATMVRIGQAILGPRPLRK
jgi:pyridoxal phosphate enzyme (YggS family)